MSKGSRRKRATRPWQDPSAFRDIADLGGQLGVDEDLELEGYEVRRVDGSRAVKDYICPECGNAIEAGEGHVVVWPEHDSDLRRHWHNHCWRFEVRRSNGAG
jgi:hypothetical protein